MASVTVYTADRMQAIEDSSVVSGTVDPVTKKLMLTTRGGTVIDGGVIQGAKGDKGDPGAGNVNTVNTKLGPDVVLTPADLGALPATQFATEAQHGIIELATTTEAAALTDPDRGITPFTLAHVKNQRWEKTASTITALGNGLFAGQTALLTLASNTFPVEIVWTGSRWEPVSWKLSGSNTQRSAFETSGVCYEGVEWYSTTDKNSKVWNGISWRIKDSGLTPCIDYSASSVGGSLTKNSNGSLLFTNITQLTLDNLFSSAARNYRLMLSIVGPSATGNLNLRCRQAGVSDSTTSYLQGFVGVSMHSNVAENIQAVGNIHWVLNRLFAATTATFTSTIDLQNPFASVRTTLTASGISMTASGLWFGHSGGGAHDQQKPFDGLTLYPTSGTISGDLSIYSYN